MLLCLLPGLAELVHQLIRGVFDGKAGVTIVQDNEALWDIAVAVDRISVLLRIFIDLRIVGKNCYNVRQIKGDAVADG